MCICLVLFLARPLLYHSRDKVVQYCTRQFCHILLIPYFTVHVGYTRYYSIMFQLYHVKNKVSHMWGLYHYSTVLAMLP